MTAGFSHRDRRAESATLGTERQRYRSIPGAMPQRRRRRAIDTWMRRPPLLRSGQRGHESLRGQQRMRVNRAIHVERPFQLGWIAGGHRIAQHGGVVRTGRVSARLLQPLRANFIVETVVRTRDKTGAKMPLWNEVFNSNRLAWSSIRQRTKADAKRGPQTLVLHI